MPFSAQNTDNMNNFSRTDLAAELIKAKGRDFDGVCKVSVVDLDSARAAAYGKSEGRYVTLETDAITGYSPRDKTRLARVLAGQLAALLPARKNLLVVGLGNANMTADALGAEVCRDIFVESGRVRTLCPGVAGNTGIESYDIVKGVADRIKPSAVIAVDSLAAASTARVCRVIQLCDAGITPGSGVSNHRERLSERTLGVPVVAIGVPLVVYASTIIRDAGGDEEGFESLIVTPKDIDLLVREAAAVVCRAINML